MKKIIIFLCLLLISFSSNTQAEITNATDSNNFITYYYQNPNPNRILNALKSYVNSDEFQNHVATDMHVINIFAYAFARLAESNPGTLREYENIFDVVGENGQRFLITIFFYYRDKINEDFLQRKLKDGTKKHERQIQEVLSSPSFGRKGIVKDVENYDYLDYLWMEFFVTGDKEPITKIIDVLAWEDLFRSRLNIWLREKHTNREKRKINNLLNKVGINVDINKDKLNLLSDFDCMFAAHLQSFGFAGRESKYGEEIIKILAFSDEDMFYMAIKGAAMWALQSNAQQHPKVLEYCKQEFEQRADKSKIELAIILELASKGSIELVPTEEEDVVILKLREENK